MRVGTADPYYLLTDHLGSTTVTTDASGDLVSELKYKPWGEVRAGSPRATDYPFTGQYSNVRLWIDFLQRELGSTLFGAHGPGG